MAQFVIPSKKAADAVPEGWVVERRTRRFSPHVSALEPAMPGDVIIQAVLTPDVIAAALEGGTAA